MGKRRLLTERGKLASSATFPILCRQKKLPVPALRNGQHGLDFTDLLPMCSKRFCGRCDKLLIKGGAADVSFFFSRFFVPAGFSWLVTPALLIGKVPIQTMHFTSLHPSPKPTDFLPLPPQPYVNTHTRSFPSPSLPLPDISSNYSFAQLPSYLLFSLPHSDFSATPLYSQHPPRSCPRQLISYDRPARRRGFCRPAGRAEKQCRASCNWTELLQRVGAKGKAKGRRLWSCPPTCFF